MNPEKSRPKPLHHEELEGISGNQNLEITLENNGSIFFTLVEKDKESPVIGSGLNREQIEQIIKFLREAEKNQNGAPLFFKRSTMMMVVDVNSNDAGQYFASVMIASAQSGNAKISTLELDRLRNTLQSLPKA